MDRSASCRSGMLPEKRRRIHNRATSSWGWVEPKAGGRGRRRAVAERDTEEARAVEIMREVYRPLYLNEAPLYFCERRTSELIKYAANAFLAMKITFINEIADLCEQIGADVQKVAKGIGMDKRIGDKFLHAGPGYGGSCFPKDTLALVKTAQDFDSPVRLIETTVAINDNRKRAMGRKVIAACGGTVRGKKIAILGLTFKPNTDDMRDAPSITIIQALLDGGAAVHVYDPEGMDDAKDVLGTCHLRQGSLRDRRRRRRRRAGHRVGRVPRARFQ